MIIPSCGKFNIGINAQKMGQARLKEIGKTGQIEEIIPKVKR
ncbi:hypothetical protein [Mesorhizobium helmanticense]|nr:hypothetical protein [Mesorhizobium helmanticense]